MSSIPTRDELIARLGGPGSFDHTNEEIADDMLAEIRRAVREELEALLSSNEPRYQAESDWGRGVAAERNEWRHDIDARLAALSASQSDASQPPEGAMRQAEHDKPGAESQASRNVQPSSERAEERAASSPCPPPALTDADALERVSKLLREDGISEASPGVLSKWAAVLRAASAPKPVDVFEAFWRSSISLPFDANHISHARDWFGPLVAALENAADQECEDKPSLDNWTCSGCWPCEAKKIISELRRKSSAEGAGTARPKGSERKAQEAGQ